ncbi:hypothetical protein IMCC3317_10180 [Kordia antarctica]|uniref:CHAT domain-containing protein n=1 Tax=Kordia antarctica TaxID=1218801 RepID=A0A7L4ZG98_9FLAO|nr:CHAT domain-containing protein [Kordia antarctica]QHI35672.1 hypothetical protein IMCC3317_10180 [Kordia antarctica]
MRILFFIFFLCSSFQYIAGQTIHRDSILNVLGEYASNYDAENLLRLSREVENYNIGNSLADSLFRANVLFFKAEAISYSGNLLATRKAYEDVIEMCTNSEEGTILKILTIRESNSIELLKGLNIIAYKKSKKANSLLDQVKNMPPPILLAIYNDLAIHSKSFGENTIASSYREKSQKVFNENEHQLTYLTKNNYYGSVLDFYKDTNVDESVLIEAFNKHKKLYESDLANSESETLTIPSYLLSQTKMGEFYLYRLKNGQKNSAEKALSYLNAVLANEKQNNVIDHYKKIAWYLKNEVLLIQNKLKEALDSNNKLIDFSREKESRMGYNRAQRIHILLRLNKVEEARKEVFKMGLIFHSVDENLKKDFSNFSPFQILEYVSIFLNLSDDFKKYGDSNAETKKVIAQLNKLALIQFKNSIDNKLTTPKIRKLFERIISNFIKIKIKGSGTGHGMTTPELLEAIENIENTLDWQEFLQNREVSEFAFVDDYNYEEATLRSEMVKARKKKQDSTILGLKLKLEQLKANFKEQYPNHSKLALSDFKIADFQDKLKMNEVVLRYENLQDSLYVFVIHKNDVQLLSLGASEAISTQINTYVSNISNRKNSDEISKKLYKQLIPTSALSFEHLNIVPDNYLFKLPFETLKNSTNAYLIEDKTIIYTPYLSLLQHNTIVDVDTENQQNSNLMIFTPSYEEISNEPIAELVRGNEYRLNGAKKESELLADLFENATFSDYSATKKNFKKHAPNAQLLHLSMHASVDLVTPELSYLLFTEGNSDNKLYIEELYGMNLKADMAVLSACSTGDGVLDVKKGMISLHRAFTHAGVPTTVASLWEAPDTATQKIMVQFYKELKAGKTKAKALQLAKLQYLKTTDDANLKTPFYWAGFVINGTNNPITFLSSETNYVVWIVLGIGIVLLFLIWFRKRNKKATKR